MIKKFSILLLALFILGLIPSCSDYLDSDRYFRDRTSLETVFTDRERTEEWLAYAYSFLTGATADIIAKAGNGSPPMSMMTQCISGDRDVKYDPKDAWDLSYNKFRLGEYNENEYNDVWPRCYKGIYQASVFIHNIDMNLTMTTEERLDYKGQARFVRAYLYWILLRKYGPVPIMPDEGIDYTLSYDDLATPPVVPTKRWRNLSATRWCRQRKSYNTSGATTMKIYRVRPRERRWLLVPML